LKPPFVILEHPSDLGIEAHGSSMEEMFRNAAHGFMSVVAGTSKIESRENRLIELQAIDREILLVRWLTEILYLYDAEKYLTADVQFETLSDTFLKANLFGETYNHSKHELKLDVKAITYHQLEIEEHDGDWTGRIFLDV
jgi:SHS2 domain-containing protein